MNATKTHQGILALRSSLARTKSILRKTSPCTSRRQLTHFRFASTSPQSFTGEQHGLSNLRGILTIAIPSILLTWGVLEYYDPHQRGQHSHMMRQALLGKHLLHFPNHRSPDRDLHADENKEIGRAHDCVEVHVSDVEKWVEQHPAYVNLGRR